MSNHKSIQILRSAIDYDISTSEEILLDGQPLYSKKDKSLYIGDGESQLQNIESLYNLQNGYGKGSTQQKWSEAHGEYSSAFNVGETHGRYSFAIGSGSIAGLTKTRFDSLYPNGLDAASNSVTAIRGSSEWNELVKQGNKVYTYSVEEHEIDGQIYKTSEYRSFAIALGQESKAEGKAAIAGGYSSKAGGNFSVALGRGSKAESNDAIALGYFNTAKTGQAAIAVGMNNTSSGKCSFAGGETTQATNSRAFAYGKNCVASGLNSVAMGTYSTASGESSVAIGGNNKCAGSYSATIGGNDNNVSNQYSFVTGRGNITNNNYQTIIGKYNYIEPAKNYVFQIGWGSSKDNRDNIFTVDTSGFFECRGGQINGLLHSEEIACADLTSYTSTINQLNVETQIKSNTTLKNLISDETKYTYELSSDGNCFFTNIYMPTPERNITYKVSNGNISNITTNGGTYVNPYDILLKVNTDSSVNDSFQQFLYNKYKYVKIHFSYVSNGQQIIDDVVAEYDASYGGYVYRQSNVPTGVLIDSVHYNVEGFKETTASNVLTLNLIDVWVPIIQSIQNLFKNNFNYDQEYETTLSIQLG